MVDGAETSFPSPPLATTPATLAPLGSDGASLTSEDTLMRLFSLIEFDRRWNLTLRRDLDMVEDCGRGEERREKRKRKRETRGKKGRCSSKGDDRDQRQLPNQRSERKGKEKESSPERRKKGWGEEELVIIHVTADRAASGRDSCSVKPSTLSRAS